ncbi:hypothetical protein ATK23_0242 [Glutamicibacter mysorens]|uniref:Uncharacterized protein n=1 Tax=Glutamicibacter mysorens TaxID=257984 RepID=A0ABX4MXX5_9MICC|nr:hypothetical protein ATK23_0242 [Glutamicibacter mysorens]
MARVHGGREQDSHDALDQAQLAAQIGLDRVQGIQQRGSVISAQMTVGVEAFLDDSSQGLQFVGDLGVVFAQPGGVVAGRLVVAGWFPVIGPDRL